MISTEIKKIINGYLNKVELSNVEIGEVLSVNPIKIKVADFPKPLTDKYLIVPKRLLQDTYPIEILDFSISHTCSNCDTQIHTGNGKATIKIEGSALAVGDKVVLVKAMGGQKFVVIDREV